MTTFTLDLPSNDPQLNRRLGYRLPRSLLLPPYLLMNAYFVDFTDSIDAVFDSTVDGKLDVLANLRNMWVTNPEQEESIAQGNIQPFDAWSQPEREMLVKQVNMLGMKLQTAGVLTNDSYHKVARFVGQYWFEKGTEAFVEFINFCLGINLNLATLWTEDYINFFQEGDSAIGTPIWEGGTWYPTTHVTINAIGGLGQIPLPTLITFFYAIANYNLVLYSVNSVYNMDILPHEIVAIGMIADNGIAISNIPQNAVTVPPIQDLSPGTSVLVLMQDPADTNWGNQYLLGAPTAWMADSTGAALPVYSVSDQQTTVDVDVPTQVIGSTGPTYSVLYGPVQWIPLPGAPTNNTTRIPAYTKIPVARTVGKDSVTTQIAGSSRSMVLVNPKGFKEVQPGYFAPYW